MIEKIYVELDEPFFTRLDEQVEFLQQRLPSQYKVHSHGGHLAVDVPDSRDAEEELTGVLDGLGITSYVRKPEADELAASQEGENAKKR